MRIHPKELTTSKELNEGLLARYDSFVALTGGIMITLPAISRSMATHEFRITNKSTGVIAVGGLSSFTNGTTCIAIEPGKSVLCRAVNANPYRWAVNGDYMEALEIPWTPTVTFNAAGNPTSYNSVFQAFLVDGCLFYSGRIWGTDADGKNLVSLTPPLPLPDVDMIFPATCWVSYNDNASCVSGMMYADQSDNTAANRIIKLRNATAMTDSKAYEIVFSGVAEIHGWTSFTPSFSWDTSSPDGTPTGRYKILGNKLVLGVFNCSGSDGGASGTGTYLHPPVPHSSLDAHFYAQGIQLVNTTYSDPAAYYNAKNSETQGVCFKALSAMTDNAAHALQVLFAYPISGMAALSPTKTFTTGTPAGSVVNRNYIASAMGIVLFGTMHEATDGNGATALVVSAPPLPAQYKANMKTALACYQVVDTTVTVPGAYIDSGQSAFASRTVKNTKFAAATDAAAFKYYASGLFPIG